MLLDLLLVARGDFLSDMILPAVALAFVFAVMINQLLKKWGFCLW